MQVETRIRDKLSRAFSPVQLSIENESHKHAHHAAMKGAANTGETHFRVSLVSDSFAGQSRVQRHRMVNDVLAEELAGPVHALSVSARTPEEASNGG
ncbi:MAG: BolA family protein [Rhodomicrobiaceae bacterium]